MFTISLCAFFKACFVPSCTDTSASKENQYLSTFAGVWSNLYWTLYWKNRKRKLSICQKIISNFLENDILYLGKPWRALRRRCLSITITTTPVTKQVNIHAKCFAFCSWKIVRLYLINIIWLWIYQNTVILWRKHTLSPNMSNRGYFC